MAGEGTIITDGKGNYKIYKGGQFVKYDGPKPGQTKGSAPAGKMSPQAQIFLNNLSTQAQAAEETARIYQQADKDIRTLKPGPNRGRFLQMAIPEEGGGFLDTLGAIVIGGPARLTGAITKDEVDAYQRLRGLQSGNVLTRQLEQKGPQTEPDAARLMLTEISPSKTTATNRSVIERGTAKTDRARARAVFYSIFANKWGLNGQAPNGMTADEMWNKKGEELMPVLLGKPQRPQGTGQVKVISRRKVR